MTLYVVVDGKEDHRSPTLCKDCMKELLAKHPIAPGEYLRTATPTWVEKGKCQFCGALWLPLTLE
jgi:hypothetical protein